MVTFPVTRAFIRARVRARWERFRPEPALMWILCTVAILWCWVKKKIVTSGVNKHYLCQMELNMYLWSTSIIWRRQLLCKVLSCAFISVIYPSAPWQKSSSLVVSSSETKSTCSCVICAPSVSLHQTASFFLHSGWCCQIPTFLSAQVTIISCHTFPVSNSDF